MRSSIITVVFLSMLYSATASVLNTTDISAVLKNVTDQTTLTVPKDAMDAISLLGKGGAKAKSVSITDTVALVTCAETARANNATAEGARGSAENIAYVTNKVTLTACESAGQQVDGKGSDDAINTLISSVGVLNANIAAAAKAKKGTKRWLAFVA